jgi:hypothetical protein
MAIIFGLGLVGGQAVAAATRDVGGETVAADEKALRRGGWPSRSKVASKIAGAQQSSDLHWTKDQ